MHLFVEPVDVWLFRDGRSFDAGSDHRAVSLFPPYPSVMQGALRSHHLTVKGVDLRDKQAVRQAVGTSTDFGPLRMRGPFLARQNDRGIVERLLPVPAHAVLQPGGLTGLKAIPTPARVLTSAPTPQLLWPTGEPTKDEGGGWLPSADLTSLLGGGTVAPIRAAQLYVTESRVGIAVDPARGVTGEGNLYEVSFVRPADQVGLLVEVDGLDGWPKEGVLHVGGEGRGGRFRQVTPEVWPALPADLPADFVVYFATPTFFDNGWCPSEWGRFFDGKVTLQAAAVNRYQSIGGRDLANNADKPARRFVPSGSVYFFHATGAARLKPGLVQQAMTDFGAEIGFGQIIIR